MKNKVFSSFEKVIDDIPDGAVIAFSTFGNVSQAMNLWEAVYDMEVKDLTVIGNMVIPVRAVTVEDRPYTSFGPSQCLLQPGKIGKVITGFTNNVYSNSFSEDLIPGMEVLEKIEVVPTTFGSICTKLEAAANGYGGILTPVGVGTILENYSDIFEIDGEQFLLEKPLVPDYGFVKAWKADTLGNLVYRRLQRLHNPLIARASKITVVEVEEIVQPGELDPDQIHTSHVYVDRIVRIPDGGKGTASWHEMMKERQFGA